MSSIVKNLVGAGIPVMGHIGLTPQSVNQLGGYKVQGKDLEGAKKLLEDAKALEEAGAFAIVLECVPAPLAEMISQQLTIPTIGIGAGKGCDGQVLVVHDLLGLFGVLPQVCRKCQLGEQMKRFAKYRGRISFRTIPREEHSFGLQEKHCQAVLGRIMKLLLVTSCKKRPQAKKGERGWISTTWAICIGTSFF